MQVDGWARYVAGVAMIMLCVASAAQAQTAQDPVVQNPAAQDVPVQCQNQTATFSAINDAVPGRLFDATRTAPDPYNSNKLIIGFNTGFDTRTWKYTDFRASTAAYNYTSAMDTISFRIEAPAGCYIASIKYLQQGTGYAIRGTVHGAASWVVGDVAGHLGFYATNPKVEGAIDLTGLNLTFVPVSITAGAFAFATPMLGSATLSISSAHVEVGLADLKTAEEPPVVEETVPPEGTVDK